MTVEQLAKKLQVSTRTIYAWVEKRKIPYYKIGQGLRFDSIEIEEWMRQKKVPAETPLNTNTDLQENKPQTSGGEI